MRNTEINIYTVEIRSTIKTEQLYFQKTGPISETKYLKGRKDMVNGRVQEEMGMTE